MSCSQAHTHLLKPQPATNTHARHHAPHMGCTHTPLNDVRPCLGSPLSPTPLPCPLSRTCNPCHVPAPSTRRPQRRASGAQHLHNCSACVSSISRVLAVLRMAPSRAPRVLAATLRGRHPAIPVVNTRYGDRPKVKGRPWADREQVT